VAKTYDVRFAFKSPSLGKWICRETVHLVPKLSEKELAHAMKQGHILEITNVPAGDQEAEATGTKAATAKGGK
jgi:hypothetical protein